MGPGAGLERTFLLVDPLNAKGCDVTDGLLAIDLESDPVVPSNVLDLPVVDDGIGACEVAA